jgi:hypothetical protein
MIIVRKKKSMSLFVLAVFVLCFIGAADVSAQRGPEPDFKPVADEMIGSSGITWVPKMNYARLILTISRPDGTVFEKTFESGSTPYVGLTGIFGDTPNDGSYTYELRVIPFTERVDRGKMDRGLRSHKALTQAGYFSVREGMIVTPGATEPENVISTPQEGLSGTKDQVILDDLIVDGSICVGFDCINGESFGFDTLRLKENNLRIRFYDTSNSASFPSNDWQITANDSSNGGANKFSIDDIDGGRTPFTIEASAPSHSLYVDDGGRIGFGTSTPVVNLHVKEGNTPTLRLEQDGSSGFTAQTWDVAGNETNFFIRDVTNGSTLPFRIRPGAPTSAIDINDDGYVGIGTSSPGFPIHVKTGSGTNAVILAEKTSGAINYMNATDTHGVFGTTTNHNLRLVRQTQVQMDLIGNSDIAMQDGGGYDGTWNNASSRELKENIKDLTIDDAMEALVGLNPVTYSYKDNKEETRVGFIAEDVPGLVAKKNRKSLSAMDIVSVLTKVVQEQQKTITELKKEIAELKKK